MFRGVILCGILVVLIAAAAASLDIDDNEIQDFKTRLYEIKNQLVDNTTQIECLEVKQEQIVREIIDSIPLNGFLRTPFDGSGLLCGACLSVFSNLMRMRRIQHRNERHLIKTATDLCVRFKVASEDICKGVIKYNAPSIIYIIDKRRDIAADTFCKLLLDNEQCRFPFWDKKFDFTVNINGGTSVRKVQPLSKNMLEYDETFENGTLTIIHVSDIHLDLKYQVGSSGNCGDYACCRKPIKKSFRSDAPAGFWGDYRSCDTPFRAIEDAFQQIISQNFQIDAIYMTGNIVDHFAWDASIIGSQYAIEKVYRYMSSVFNNISIYPAIGSNEAQNLFPPADVKDSSLSVQWLYDQLADLWQVWLPPDALVTVSSGGYYTTVVRPGLRLIALNNNVCLTFNWWYIYDLKSIQRQFQWLHDVLLAAEKAGELVHILAHIPNGDEQYQHSCSREFRRIVDRFYNTIAAQFNGHTGDFGFNIFYKNNNEAKPVSVAWNGGSLATFSGVNRNYVEYDVDPVSYKVVDAEVWTYNLTDANLDDGIGPMWYQQLTLLDAFSLADLTPSTLDAFVTSLPGNMDALQQLWQLQIRYGDLRLRKGCTKKCLQKLLCAIVTSDNSDRSKCEKIKSQMKHS